MSQESALDEVNGKIQELHELAFSVIEEKKNGATLVPIEDYERLLNHYIEHIQDMRDAVLEFGNQCICGRK